MDLFARDISNFNFPYTLDSKSTNVSFKVLYNRKLLCVQQTNERIILWTTNHNTLNTHNKLYEKIKGKTHTTYPEYLGLGV